MNRWAKWNVNPDTKHGARVRPYFIPPNAETNKLLYQDTYAKKFFLEGFETDDEWRDFTAFANEKYAPAKRNPQGILMDESDIDKSWTNGRMGWMFK